MQKYYKKLKVIRGAVKCAVSFFANEGMNKKNTKKKHLRGQKVFEKRKPEKRVGKCKINTVSSKSKQMLHKHFLNSQIIQ